MRDPVFLDTTSFVSQSMLNMTIPTILRKPSAFLPLAMSLIALAVVLVHIAVFGAAREADEGAAAHLWQLLMAAQLPLLIFFATRWLPRNPKQALLVMALQVSAVVAPCTCIFIQALGRLGRASSLHAGQRSQFCFAGYVTGCRVDEPSASAALKCICSMRDFEADCGACLFACGACNAGTADDGHSDQRRFWPSIGGFPIAGIVFVLAVCALRVWFGCCRQVSCCEAAFADLETSLASGCRRRYRRNRSNRCAGVVSFAPVPRRQRKHVDTISG